jgi:hypothetical protein
MILECVEKSSAMGLVFKSIIFNLKNLICTCENSGEAYQKWEQKKKERKESCGVLYRGTSSRCHMNFYFCDMMLQK